MDEVATCVVCGAETPREEMFGPPDSLRCPACAERARKRMTIGIPRKLVREYPPVVTAALIVASVAATWALKWGHVEPEKTAWMFQNGAILDGEVWRHLTCTLLHGDILHILFNMWWLWYFGKAIEERWSPAGMLALWVGIGMGSSSLQWLADGPGIGMSGVVYGLWGMLFALRRTKDYAARTANPQVNRILVVWGILCVFLTMSGTWAVANWAHGGGAALGFLLGKAVDSKRRMLLVPAAFAGMIALGVATIWIWPVRFW